MEPKSSILKSITKIALILAGISTFTVFTLGWSLSNIHNEIKTLRISITRAKEAVPNFEKSLTLYTGDTKPVIDYLMHLRPESEEAYISFINSIENIGQKLDLNLKLESNDEPNKIQEELKTLQYTVKFYGGIEDLNNFLEELEKMPHFIQIEKMNYANISKENERIPNIQIKLNLFIK